MDTFKRRLQKLREAILAAGLEAVLVTARENYFYMSGFGGTSAVLFITQKEALLITDFRYAEQSAKQAPDYEIVIFSGNSDQKLREIISERKLQKLGFEGASMTYESYSTLSEKLLPCSLISVESIFADLRIIKDEHEMKDIRRAVEIADAAFVHILGSIKPGVSELELAAEMEYFMRKNGASGTSFETILASGQRSSLPHGLASEKKLELGDAITMDFGAIYNGYCSDMTRTVFLGEPVPQLKEIYRIVLQAQLKGLESIKEGVTGKEADWVARQIISEYGYGDNFGHGLGHGVGIEIHEEPYVSIRGEKTLKNGMVVTVEPGIYVSGLGGVRIEDMVIVNNSNPILLTSSTKEMIVL